MGLLDSLLGAAQQRAEYQDFAQRYSQGHPADGYDDREVLQRYQQVAPQLSAREYELSAEEAFSRMPPQERLQFGRLLQQRARQSGYTGFTDQDGDGVDDRFQDAGYLARMTGQLQQQSPGLLGQLFSGGQGGAQGGGQGGGLLDNPLAKAALAGIAASAVSRALGGAAGGARRAGVSRGSGYRIGNLASRKLLANPQGSRQDGTTIIQWEATGEADQEWQLQRGRSGGTLLVNAASGKVLANPQGSQANGTQMIQWEPTGEPDQEWLIEPGRNGGVRLRNLASRKLLANPQSSGANGTVMIQWEDTGGADQEWLFDPPLQLSR